MVTRARSLRTRGGLTTLGTTLLTLLPSLARAGATLVFIADFVRLFLTAQIQHLHGELVNYRCINVQMPQGHGGGGRRNSEILGAAAMTTRHLRRDVGHFWLNSVPLSQAANVDQTRRRPVELLLEKFARLGGAVGEDALPPDELGERFPDPILVSPGLFMRVEEHLFARPEAEQVAFRLVMESGDVVDHGNVPRAFQMFFELLHRGQVVEDRGLLARVCVKRLDVGACGDEIIGAISRGKGDSSNSCHVRRDRIRFLRDIGKAVALQNIVGAGEVATDLLEIDDLRRAATISFPFFIEANSNEQRTRRCRDVDAQLLTTEEDELLQSLIRPAAAVDADAVAATEAIRLLHLLDDDARRTRVFGEENKELHYFVLGKIGERLLDVGAAMLFRKQVVEDDDGSDAEETHSDDDVEPILAEDPSLKHGQDKRTRVHPFLLKNSQHHPGDGEGLRSITMSPLELLQNSAKTVEGHRLVGGAERSNDL